MTGRRGHFPLRHRRRHHGLHGGRDSAGGAASDAGAGPRHMARAEARTSSWPCRSTPVSGSKTTGSSGRWSAMSSVTASRAPRLVERRCLERICSSTSMPRSSGSPWRRSRVAAASRRRSCQLSEGHVRGRPPCRPRVCGGRRAHHTHTHTKADELRVRRRRGLRQRAAACRRPHPAARAAHAQLRSTAPRDEGAQGSPPDTRP